MAISIPIKIDRNRGSFSRKWHIVYNKNTNNQCGIAKRWHRLPICGQKWLCYVMLSFHRINVGDCLPVFHQQKILRFKHKNVTSYCCFSMKFPALLMRIPIRRHHESLTSAISKRYEHFNPQSRGFETVCYVLIFSRYRNGHRISVIYSHGFLIHLRDNKIHYFSNM